MHKSQPKIKTKSNKVIPKTRKSKQLSKRLQSTTTTPPSQHKLYDNHRGTFLSFKGHRPKVTGRTYISPDALIIGDVVIGPESCVLSNITIRGDNDTITIGAFSNVQEGSVLHTDAGLKLTIGNHVSIGHKAMIHGATIGNNTLIGMGATVMNRVQIGRNCIIGANALILEGVNIPDNSVVVGSPGKVIRQCSDKDIDMIKRTALAYSSKIDHFFGMIDVLPEITQIDPQVYSNAV